MIQINNNSGKWATARSCYGDPAELLSLRLFKTLSDSKASSLPACALIAHGRRAIGEQLAVGASAIRKGLFENHRMIFVFRLVLAGTFLVSSLGKFVDIEHYSVAMVYNFNLLPVPLAIGVGWAVPFIELACAVGLLFGVFTRLSALGIALMSAGFFVSKVILLSRGVDVECGCFGAVVSTMASSTIYLDPTLFLLSVTILFSSRQSRQWASLGYWLSEKWSTRLNLAWGGLYGTNEQ